MDWNDRPSALTFAVECRITELGEELCDLVAQALNHSSPIVREGCIDGLDRFKLVMDAIHERILDVADNDKSPAVRTVANRYL